MSSNNAARGRRLELSSDEDSSSSSSSSAVVTVRTRPGLTPADQQPPHPTTGATASTARRSGRTHTRPNRRLFDQEPAEEGGRRREHHRHEESTSQRQ